MTSGLSELTGPILDAAIDVGGKEVEDAAEAFWKQEDGRKAAMQQFRNALLQLTSPTPATFAPKPLIVVIDELDRCRPDYALSVLEVVKHFFAVPRVHFVLGVNLDALAHIVRVRYGAGVDAEDYLKRFITLSMQLPEIVEGHQEKRSQLRYFESAATEMGLGTQLVDTAKPQIELAAGTAKMSLRDVEKIISRLVLLPRRKEMESFLWGWRELIVSLVLLQVMRPDLFKAAFAGSLEIERINDFYGISPDMVSTETRGTGHYNHRAYIVQGLWTYVLSKGKLPEKDNEDFSRAFDHFGSRGVDKLLSGLRRDFFSTFEIMSERGTAGE